MLNKDIFKTVKLIKKSYNHPKIFLLLINHLSHLAETVKININYVNDSFVRICLLASSIYLCKQFSKIHSQDKQILQFLKNGKSLKYNTQLKLKFKILLIYLINRPLDQMNKFICFEIINSYTDCKFLYPFILQYLMKFQTVKLFDIELKKSIPIEYIDIFFQKSSSNNDLLEETQKLIIYSFSGVNYKIYPLIDFLHQINSDQSDLKKLIIFELLIIFAKNHANTDEVRGILSDDKYFVSCMKKFILKEKLFNRSYENLSIDYSKLTSNEDPFILSLKQEIRNRKDSQLLIKNIKKALVELEKSFEYLISFLKSD